MWSWHHWAGVGILAQDRESLALRVIDIPDPGLFTAKYCATEEEAARACEKYVAAAVAEQLRAGEREVPPSEFVRSSADGGTETLLSCPTCRSLLYWRE